MSICLFITTADEQSFEFIATVKKKKTEKHSAVLHPAFCFQYYLAMIEFISAISQFIRSAHDMNGQSDDMFTEFRSIHNPQQFMFMKYLV